MSAPEHFTGDEPSLDPIRSKIKLIRNAKGDTQWEISVVAGEQEDELERIRDLAVKQHRALLEEVSGSWGVGQAA